MTDVGTKMFMLEKRLETLEKKIVDVPHMKGLKPREGDIPVFSESENRWVPANFEKFGYMWLSHGSDKKVEACRFGHPLEGEVSKRHTLERVNSLRHTNKYDCEGDVEQDRKLLSEENTRLKQENEVLKAKISMLESNHQTQKYFQNIK